MDRERGRDLPELEVELQPAASGTGSIASDRSSPNPRLDRRLTVVALVVALVAAFVAFVALDGDDPAPESAVPTLPAAPTRPIPVTATAAAATTTRWTPAPGLLGATDTGLMLWSFDGDSKLQWVDLDTGEVQSLSPSGGAALAAFDRGSIVIYAQGATQTFGNGGNPVIDSKGNVVQRLDGLVPPVAVRDTPYVWVQTTDGPRRWQLRHPDRGIVVELLPDAASTIVHSDSRTSLLVTRDGTSSFDLASHATQRITTTQVVAAAARWMIGLRCSNDQCTLTAIDVATLTERVLRADLSRFDVAGSLLSPDGRYLAITRKPAEPGRYAEIIDVATSRSIWSSSLAVSFTGLGPAWSWSPDSRYFFVAMSERRVIALDVRENPAREIGLDLPHTPFHGIAVTAR